MFQCDRCGCCCRNIHLSSLYAPLDRGDGVCKYLDEQTSLCSIYATRPVECNIDAMFDAHFSKIMSKSEFYELNYKVCKDLKHMSHKKNTD